MSFDAFGIIWLLSGLFAFPLLLGLLRQQGEVLKLNAVDIAALCAILIICTLLGVVSLVFCVALPLMPKRAPVLGPVDSEGSALLHMVLARAKVDDRLNKSPTPQEWPEFVLWKTREASLLYEVDGLLWRAEAQGRGLSNDELVSAIAPAVPDCELKGGFSARVLEAEVAIAAEWVRCDMVREKRENYPHPNSWRQAVDQEELDELGPSLIQDGHPCRAWCEWRKLKARMLTGDTVLRYDNGHRAGVVLTRGSQAVAHIGLMRRCH